MMDDTINYELCWALGFPAGLEYKSEIVMFITHVFLSKNGFTCLGLGDKVFFSKKNFQYN